MKRVTGGSLPTINWRDLMFYAHLNKEPAYLPGGNRLIARERGRNRAPRGNTLWDDLFGSTGSTGSASGDTTLGTPVASRGRGQQQNKSWFEDFFAR